MAKAMTIGDEHLVQHLKEVHRDADTTSFGVLDFASAFGSPLEALMYGKLFWPDFVEFEGMVFLETLLQSNEDRSRVLAALEKSSMAEVERSFNRFEMPTDFFASHRVPITDEENLNLTRKMAETWRARLAQAFPERQFTVEVEESPDASPTLVVSECR